MHSLATVSQDDDDDDDEEDSDDDEDQDDSDNEVQSMPCSSTSTLSEIAKQTITIGDAPCCNGNCRGEIRRWQTGDYTLCSSVSPEYSELSAIDAMFYLNAIERVTGNSEAEVNEAISLSDNDEPQPGPSTFCSTSKEAVTSTNSVKNNNNNSNTEMLELTDDEEYDEQSEMDCTVEEVGSEEIDDEDHESEVSDLSSEPEIDATVEKAGGYVNYIDEKLSYDLLSIEPINNCLNLVFRLKGTQRYVKRISSSKAARFTVPFHEISFVYRPSPTTAKKSN